MTWDSSYYKKKIMIAACDKKGNILGEIERWEAHEKGILHRAFTVALLYKDQYLIQHRKHPVFDGVLDVTSSSHQIYTDNTLQDTIDATYVTLKREWNVHEKDLLGRPRDEGWIYYKAQDKFSPYIEHEVCNIVFAEVKALPQYVPEVAYGYSLASKKDLYNTKSRLYSQLAPWVQTMIKEKVL